MWSYLTTAMAFSMLAFREGHTAFIFLCKNNCTRSIDVFKSFHTALSNLTSMQRYSLWTTSSSGFSVWVIILSKDFMNERLLELFRYLFLCRIDFALVFMKMFPQTVCMIDFLYFRMKLYDKTGILRFRIPSGREPHLGANNFFVQKRQLSIYFFFIC